MTAYHWGRKSERIKSTLVDPLQRVLDRLIQITPQDLTLVSGRRTEAQQKIIFDSGASKTMNSRHLTGHAIDLAPWIDGRIPWKDIDAFKVLGASMFEAADAEGVLLQWGADWDFDADHTDETFLDFNHFQIPWPYNEPKARAAMEKRVKARELNTVIRPSDDLESEIQKMRAALAQFDETLAGFDRD